jgi:hypothetical protein
MNRDTEIAAGPEGSDSSIIGGRNQPVGSYGGAQYQHFGNPQPLPDRMENLSDGRYTAFSKRADGASADTTPALKYRRDDMMETENGVPVHRSPFRRLSAALRPDIRELP